MMGFLAVVIFSGCSYWTAASYGGEDVIGIIRASNLNMRPTAGTHQPPVLKLQPGYRVKILQHEGQWLRISYENQVGYILNKPHYIDIQAKNEPAAILPAEPKQDPPASSGKDIDQMKQTASSIVDEIEKSEARVLHIKKEERAILNRLNDIDLRLNGYRQRMRRLKSDLKILDKKIAENSAAMDLLARKIEANEVYAAKRLVALYKLTWLGHMPALGSAETLYDFVARKSNLERILIHDQKAIKDLVESRQALQTHLQTIHDQKQKKRAVQKQLDQQIKNISNEKNSRAGLLKKIRSQHSLELAAIEALKKTAQALDRRMRSFATRQESALPEGQPFFASKGLLNMPVEGKIVSFFGPFKNTKYNVVNYQRGINIKADRGEPIQAVYAGRVLFANWFKGYGNMIILDHGDHYYTVYAHAEEVFKAQGELVEAGEVIATVGDSGSMTGPALHFEVRHHGKPEDPLNWIKKG
jgi:septal ring factor EnvC (AmiA/AmiB activator)